MHLKRPRDRPQQGGFAGAVAARDRHDAAVGDGELDAVENVVIRALADDQL
jgi:hypothetical protein